MNLNLMKMRELRIFGNFYKIKIISTSLFVRQEVTQIRKELKSNKIPVLLAAMLTLFWTLKLSKTNRDRMKELSSSEILGDQMNGQEPGLIKVINGLPS